MFLRGTACPEADQDQKALFVQEVCAMLPLLSGQCVLCVCVCVCVCLCVCVWRGGDDPRKTKKTIQEVCIMLPSLCGQCVLPLCVCVCVCVCVV